MATEPESWRWSSFVWNILQTYAKPGGNTWRHKCQRGSELFSFWIQTKLLDFAAGCLTCLLLNKVIISNAERAPSVTWCCICFWWRRIPYPERKRERELTRTTGYFSPWGREGGMWATVQWKVAGHSPASRGQAVMNILPWPQKACGGSSRITIGKGL